MLLVLERKGIRPNELFMSCHPALGVPIELRPDRNTPWTRQVALREQSSAHPGCPRATHIRYLLRANIVGQRHPPVRRPPLRG